MFPTDSDFIILYIAYLLMFVSLMIGLMFSKKKAYFKWNALVFIGYFLLMIYIFSDSENFNYGNSLSVLFYGIIFVFSHFIILGLIKLYRFLTSPEIVRK